LLMEVQPGKDLGYEIFEKCSLITGIQYSELFHSGEAKPGSIRKRSRPEELFIGAAADKEIRTLIQLTEGDGYVAARGPTKPVLHSLKKTVERCKQAFDGVPQETRRALANGNNEFLRVIHGKERLYPDTDTPPLPYPPEKYESIKNQAHLGPLELLKKYESGNLNWTQLTNIIRTEKVSLFERMVDKGVSVQLTFFLIHDLLKRLAREGLDTSNITDDILLDVGSEVSKGNLNRGTLPHLLRDLCKHHKIDEQKELIEKEKAAQINKDQLRSIVTKKIESMKVNNVAPDRKDIMGSLRKEHGPRLDGKALAALLEELL